MVRISQLLKEDNTKNVNKMKKIKWSSPNLIKFKIFQAKLSYMKNTFAGQNIPIKKKYNESQ